MSPLLIFGNFLILMQIVVLSKQKCVSERSSLLSFRCIRTNQEDFFYDFLEMTRQSSIDIKNKNTDYGLIIENSYFPRLHSFIPPIPLNVGHLNELTITDSSVEFIESDAFELLIDMTVLVLSNNKLKDISFVKSLPSSLKKLNLGGNHFETVHNVFDHLYRLIHLDLSNCNISKIDGNSFKKFNSIFLNISNNSLHSLDLVLKNEIQLELDASFNQIKYINYYNTETIYFRGLNVSHNKIQRITDVLDVKNGFFNNSLNYLDLSWNHLISLKLFLKSFNCIHNLNLIDSKINVNMFSELREGNVMFNGILNLNKNNFSSIPPYLFKNTDKLKKLNLVKASVKNIDENAFNSLGIYYVDFFPAAINASLNIILNISYNSLTTLKNYTFNNTFIHILDISKSSIQRIENNAFFGVRLIEKLILSNNQITFLNANVLQNLYQVKSIDLSFNILKKLNNNLFVNCKNLNILNLSSSQIEIMQNDTLNGTINLKELDLRNNLISTIEFYTFSFLDVINLKNNKLADLNFSFFQNLFTMHISLQGNKIQALKNNPISNMKSHLKTMDLSQSNIKEIESNTFQGLKNLELLNLRDNFIRNISEGTFVPLKKLIELDLSGNDIAILATDSFAFGNQLHLMDITLHRTNLLSKTFITLNHLEHLNIYDSDLIVLQQDCFKGLINLKNLNLLNVKINEITVGAFRGLDNLYKINSQIIFKYISFLKRGMFEGLQNLDLIDLSCLNITDIESNGFEGLVNLKVLLLNGNKINSIINGTFLGLDLLEKLNLSYNKIERLEANAFLGLDRLLELSLSDNNLINIFLGTFQNFPKLRILDLKMNNINKIMTGTFSNLKSLVVLDLSYNNISTLKMKNLFSLTSLKSLDLTSNHLIEIKYLELLKSLRQLEFVGLNNNKWKCDELASMLIVFQNYSTDWLSTKEVTYYHENIDGIKCIDICKIFYCIDEENPIKF